MKTIIGLCLLVLVVVQDVQGGCKRCSRQEKYTYRGWWTWYYTVYYCCPVDGRWSAYTPVVWNDCSTTCGPGTRTGKSTRKCNNPAPAYGGKSCSGSGTKISYETCNLRKCPIDGGWTAYGKFSDWSACSFTCGVGTKSREQTRTCTNPEPEYGGKDCVGSYRNIETEDCDMKDCPDTICKAKKSGRTNHLQMCRKYISCENSKATVMECANGTVWNNEIQTCDFPKDDSCIKIECINGEHLPHETDPKKYYICANHRPVEKTCENDLVWDVKINNCNHAKPEAEDPSATVFTCTADGDFADPEDCTKFYKCHSGKAHSMPCPKGLYWNQSGKYCGYDQTDCK